MYGSLLKSITKNKEYRYNDIVSAYDTRYSDSVKKFLPKALPDGPESPRLFSTDRVSGVAFNSFNASPVLPAYLTILGYTDFTSFVERYYNWLFTSSPENDKGFGSGYYTDTDDIYKLIDIDRVSFVDADSDGEDDDGEFISDPDLRAQIVTLIASQFAEGLENEIEKSIGQQSSVVDFVKEARTEFYIKKTNKAALQWYFEKLYPDQNFRVTVTEPKTQILRLDGGRPPFASSTGNILLSPSNKLGEKVLQDSEWYQDYSYLLKLENSLTGSPVEFDKQQYDTVAHPAGIKVIFDVTNDDYIPPDDFDGEFGQREITIIGNYNPYRLNDTTGTASTAGCGMTLADGDSPLPTFAHPGWSEFIPVGAAFGNINIGSFFFLSPAENSPNTGLSASYNPSESPCA